MKVISLDQLPLIDDFFWYDLSDGSGKAIVIYNPQDALSNSIGYVRSRKTLEEHIEYIRQNNVKSAIVIAEDISFLTQCPSLEALWIMPAVNAEEFDYSPLYKMKNIRWLQCETIYGEYDSKSTCIDYSYFSNLETLRVCNKKGHLNIDKAKNVSTLFLWEVPKDKNLKGLLPGNSVVNLSITHSSIHTLEGIEITDKLSKLKLCYCRKLNDISILSCCAETLTELEIDHCGNLEDLSVLNELHNLESLTLRGNNKIENISFLRQMPNLKKFECKVNILNGDLSLCENIPSVWILDRRHYSHRNKDLPKAK